MKLVKVKIADVGEDGEVGRVGLTQIDGGNGVRDLEKGKSYY
jgi:hypothetical protein